MVILPSASEVPNVRIGPVFYDVRFEPSDRIADHERHVLFIDPGLPPEALPLAIAQAVSAAWADRLATFARCLTSQWEAFSGALDAIEETELEVTEDEADIFTMIVRLRRLGVKFHPQFLLQMGEAVADAAGGESFIDDEEYPNLTEEELAMTDAEQTSDDEPGFPHEFANPFSTYEQRESSAAWKMRKLTPRPQLFIPREEDMIEHGVLEHGEDLNADEQEAMHEHDCDEHGALEALRIPEDQPAWSPPRDKAERARDNAAKNRIVAGIEQQACRREHAAKVAAAEAERIFSTRKAQLKQAQATKNREVKRQRVVQGLCTQFDGHRHRAQLPPNGLGQIIQR